MIYLFDNVYLRPYFTESYHLPHAYTSVCDPAKANQFGNENSEGKVYIGDLSLKACIEYAKAQDTRVLIYAHPEDFNRILNDFLFTIGVDDRDSMISLLKRSIGIRPRFIRQHEYIDCDLFKYHYLKTDQVNKLDIPGDSLPGVEWLLIKEKISPKNKYTEALIARLRSMYQATMMSYFYASKEIVERKVQINEDMEPQIHPIFLDPELVESSSAFPMISAKYDLVAVAKQVCTLTKEMPAMQMLASSGKFPTDQELLADVLGNNQLNIFGIHYERGLVDPYLIRFGAELVGGSQILP